MTATAPPPQAGGTACPRCGAHVAENQDWCLRCGDAARTRLVPTPNWRLPLLLGAIVAAFALLVIAVSFVQLTRDDAPVTPTTTVPTAAAAPPAPATTAAPTTPGATTPGATTTTPGATTPGATTPGATTTTPGATTPAAPGATTTTPGATTPGATTPGTTSTTP